MVQAVSRLLDHTGKPFKRPAQRPARIPIRVKAKYDAAQTTQSNQGHWQHADALSAREANSLEVRKKLRERARYEVANNSYANGIVGTLANQMVGAGPTLRVLTPNQRVNEAVEAAFAAWADVTRLADQLRTMKRSKTTDGETFPVLTTNPLLPDPVQLDVRLVEADQVTDPTFLGEYGDPLYVDGIRYDKYGNPLSYDVLRFHPGDTRWGWEREYDRLPARSVLHWFRCDRPGQVRGIPELTPALPLFAILRRFTLATITAAETAAMFAALLTAAANPDTAEFVEGEPFETLEIEPGMMTTLPTGYSVSQLQAEHPNSTYSDFVTRLMCEIARCLNMPLHLALGDYSNSNYSTARLGSQDFRLAVKVERQDCEREVLDPMLAAWLDEAVMIPDLLPAEIGAYLAPLPHVWHWPAWDWIDPQTEIGANAQALETGQTSLAKVAAQNGDDWQELIRQQAVEEAYRKKVREEMGLDAPPAATAPPEEEPEGMPLAEEEPEDAEARASLNAFDPDQPRDDAGRFGEGGGSSTEKGGERREPAREVQKAREKEDADIKRARDQEDATIDRAREDEDIARERARDRQDRVVERARRKEDKEQERAWQKEDDRQERADEKEERRHERQWKKEIGEMDAREEAELDKAPESEHEAIQEKSEREFREAQKRNRAEEAERDAQRGLRDEAKEQAREKVREETKARREQEDKETSRQRRAEDDEREGRRGGEDEASDARRKAEDDALDARREQEDRANAVGVPDLAGCGGPGSGVPGPCPTGRKEAKRAPKPRAKKAPPPAVQKAEKGVERAKAKLEKAKSGVVKAQKDLADAKAKLKTEKASAMGAVKKAAAKAPANVAEQTKAMRDLSNRFADPRLSLEEIDTKVADMAKTVNKAGAIEIARSLGVVPTTRTTKKEAIAKIRQNIRGRKGSWDRAEMVGPPK